MHKVILEIDGANGHLFLG